MRTTHRPYAEVSGDFNRLCRFVADLGDHGRTHSTWPIGRVVDWRYGLYENRTAVAGFCENNAHLWFDAFGDLVGSAVSEEGGADFAIITMAGYRFLYEEILQWVLANWSERAGSSTTELTENQRREAQMLERLGFAVSSSFLTLRFDLSLPLQESFPLGEGYSIVDMHTHPNYREQRLLRDNAFKGSLSVAEEELTRELEFYNYGHQGPIYHPQADLCVMAADGTFVSGCEALIDARNAAADIERVCTHSGYRRRGFARAVILECLHRLQEMGLSSAYITGYSPAAMALYSSLGHIDQKKSFIYERAGV